MIDLDRQEQLIVTRTTKVFDPDGSISYIWSLDAPIVGAYASGAKINYVAFPVTVMRSAKVGEKTLIVDSETFIVPGDQAFFISRPASTLVSTPVVEVTSVSKDSVISMKRSRWLVSVAELHQDVSVNDYMYLRALVAYRSTLAPLPTMSGPYVFDIAGGKTFGSGSDDLKISAEFHNNDITYSVGGRHSEAISLPIRSGDISLWRFEMGKIKIKSLDNVVVTLDENGECAFGVELPVEVNVELDWIIEGQLSFMQLQTDDNIVINSDQTVNVRWSGKTRKMVLLLAGAAGSKISISTNPIRRGYRSMQYSYVAQTHTTESWSGSHLQLKPLLKQLIDSVAHDVDQNSIELSSGGIIL
jgi:hypothetical protein